jgi:serine/threonine protein kinase
MSRNVVGEGSYGCVHKPSIHCKSGVEPGFDYKDYVSKIMKRQQAEKELEEFVVIGSYDKNNEYHLGTPIMCSPKLNKNIIQNDISKCRNINAVSVKDHPDDYKILLLKYGGPDLKEFCDSHINKYLATNKKQKVAQFWLEVHHLIKGLQFFKNNGIVHYDIKPQNILFNNKTGKLVYIDFGLMRSKSTIVRNSKTSTNSGGVYHWSYPFDCGFMNKSKYDRYKNYSDLTKDTYKAELINMICFGSKVNTLNIPIHRPRAFEVLFSYINPDGSPPMVAKQTAYIYSFFNGFNNLIKSNSYDYVLDHITDSIDVFGLGFTLQFILNCFLKHGAINQDFFIRLSIFFRKMYDFNPETRELNIDNLLNEYENILLETGVLTMLKKSFRNNTLVDDIPVSPILMKKIVEETKTSTSRSKKLSKELEKLANLDVITDKKMKECPDGKELNIATNRCVKKCEPGQIRNDKFKCVTSKNKKSTNNNAKTRKKDNVTKRKKCPQGKTINPLTKRCVKKCEPGQIRNELFKCVSPKKENQPRVEKQCPEGKTNNPLTNRCVKKCEPGQIRNEQFKCVSPKTKK